MVPPILAWIALDEVETSSKIRKHEIGLSIIISGFFSINMRTKNDNYKKNN